VSGEVEPVVLRPELADHGTAELPPAGVVEPDVARPTDVRNASLGVASRRRGRRGTDRDRRPWADRDALAGAALPVDIRRVGSGRTRRRGSSCALAVHGDPRRLPQLSAQQAADFLHRPRACSQASPRIRRLRRPDPHRTRSAGASQATSRAPRTDGARVASALAAHECSSCAREYSAADLAETSSLSRMGSESSTEVRSRPL